MADTPLDVPDVAAENAAKEAAAQREAEVRACVHVCTRVRCGRVLVRARSQTSNIGKSRRGACGWVCFERALWWWHGAVLSLHNASTGIMRPTVPSACLLCKCGKRREVETLKWVSHFENRVT